MGPDHIFASLLYWVLIQTMNIMHKLRHMPYSLAAFVPHSVGPGVAIGFCNNTKLDFRLRKITMNLERLTYYSVFGVHIALCTVIHTQA